MLGILPPRVHFNTRKLLISRLEEKNANIFHCRIICDGEFSFGRGILFLLDSRPLFVSHPKGKINTETYPGVSVESQVTYLLLGHKKQPDLKAIKARLKKDK